MKKILFFIMLLLGCSGAIHAQSEEQEKVAKRIKEVQEYKMKYLAQEMELSEVQKKKFFELYDEMQKDRHTCFKEALQLDRSIKHDKNASEEDYQKVTDALNQANAEWATAEKQYNEKFAEFLTSKQIYKMREAENNFRSKFEEMKHSRKREMHKKHEK